MSNYTCEPGRRFTRVSKFLVSGAFFILLSSLPLVTQAQNALEVPVKMEVDKGSADNIHLKVMKNGKESFSQNGSKSFKLKLEFNQTYTLSFSKPGYVTKTIEVNTNAPAARILQGFEAYKIGIKLFIQEEGNTVMYNQPVGKIRFEESLDDFNYETDYSKSILSAFDTPEKKDSVTKAEEPPPVAEKKKETPKEKPATAEEPKPIEVKAAALPVASTEAKVETIKPVAEAKTEVQAEGDNNKIMAQGASGSSSPERNHVYEGADIPEIMKNRNQGADAPDPDAVLAEDITVTKEEITEKNRIIIKVKVTSPKKETSYSIVQYNWGGRYFFRESTSINETLFTLWTGVSP